MNLFLHFHNGVSKVVNQVLKHGIEEEQQKECASEDHDQLSFFKLLFKEFREELCNQPEDAKTDKGTGKVGNDIIDIRQSRAENLHQFDQKRNGKSPDHRVFK